MGTQKPEMIGLNIPVRDAALKVTGQLKYVGDMVLPRMLHAKVLFSPCLLYTSKVFLHPNSFS